MRPSPGRTATAHPLIAEGIEIQNCLSFMEPRPLKLVASRLIPGLGEVQWRKPRWSFTARNGSVVRRPLLPHAADTFQFSVADKSSRQEAHSHGDVFEILVSQSPIAVRYGPGLRRRRRLRAGALLIPPGLWHEVRLSGLTWVFQAACGHATVHGDKQTRP